MTIKEYYEKRPFILAVDCDGTLWNKDAKWPQCGTPRQEIINQVKKFKAAGAYIILWTCRGNSILGPVKEFCKQHGIVYDAINKNYKKYDNGFAKRKIYADKYIDDQAISPEDFAILDVQKMIDKYKERS